MSTHSVNSVAPQALRVGSDSHGDTFRKKFAADWASGDHCDLELVVEGLLFPVHKTIMVLFCPYIERQVASQTGVSRIELGGVRTGGVQAVLEFIYNGSVTLTMDAVHRIMEASHTLEVQMLTKLCCDFLIERITIDNCVENLNYIRELHLDADNIHAHLILFTARRFHELAERSQHVHMDVADLCLTLESDHLNVPSEMHVFRAAVNWLRASPPRQVHNARVLRCIRFGLLEGTAMVDVKKHPYMQTEQCASLREAAIDYHLSNQDLQGAHQPYMGRQRTGQQVESVNPTTYLQQHIGHKSKRSRKRNTITQKHHHSPAAQFSSHDEGAHGNYGEEHGDTSSEGSFDCSVRDKLYGSIHSLDHVGKTTHSYMKFGNERIFTPLVTSTGKHNQPMNQCLTRSISQSDNQLHQHPVNTTHEKVKYMSEQELQYDTNHSQNHYTHSKASLVKVAVFSKRSRTESSSADSIIPSPTVKRSRRISQNSTRMKHPNCSDKQHRSHTPIADSPTVTLNDLLLDAHTHSTSCRLDSVGESIENSGSDIVSDGMGSNAPLLLSPSRPSKRNTWKAFGNTASTTMNIPSYNTVDGQRPDEPNVITSRSNSTHYPVEETAQFGQYDNRTPVMQLPQVTSNQQVTTVTIRITPGSEPAQRIQSINEGGTPSIIQLPPFHELGAGAKLAEAAAPRVSMPARDERPPPPSYWLSQQESPVTSSTEASLGSGSNDHESSGKWKKNQKKRHRQRASRRAQPIGQTSRRDPSPEVETGNCITNIIRSFFRLFRHQV